MDNWYDGGCEILYFVVEYKKSNNDGYMLVSNNVKPELKKFVVADLTASTRYSLRMSAHSRAGSSTEEYEFVTLNDLGGMATPNLNLSVNTMSFKALLFLSRHTTFNGHAGFQRNSKQVIWSESHHIGCCWFSGFHRHFGPCLFLVPTEEIFTSRK